MRPEPRSRWRDTRSGIVYVIDGWNDQQNMVVGHDALDPDREFPTPLLLRPEDFGVRLVRDDGFDAADITWSPP